MSRKNYNRRQFLGEASCAALGSTAFLSSFLNLGMINTISARPHILGASNDYKAMVCILLAGGADTHNFLVPTESSEYSDYQATRGSLALGQNNGQLLPLDYDDNGRTFSVHSGLSDVRDMFDNGDLSFIANIGTLVEPITNYSEYQNGAKKLPFGLYSHSDQVMQWQTSVPTNRSTVGVAGRMADLMNDMNSVSQISMNISLAGRNRFQTGNDVSEYAISRNANESNVGLDGFPSWWSDSGYINGLKNGAINNMVEQEYANIFQKTAASITGSTLNSVEVMQDALANVIPMAPDAFSNTNLSNEMKKIAELISVRSFLGAQRQIFYVTYGGWDHHDDVINNQNNMLPVVNNALKEFNDAMSAIGMKDNVVTFTISDFARTLTSNGNGSDHAWGGNQMIMGGPITGKQIFGDYPSLDLDNNDLNVSQRGRLIPTTSVDEFYAELALWFGASPNDLDYILPNLCNFYSSSNCTQPVGPGYMPIGMFS